MRRSAVIRVARRDLSLASVRYRGLLPGCALRRLGWSVSVVSDPVDVPDGTSLVWAVKPLSSKDVVWTESVIARGIPTVVDICDNVLLDEYGDSGGAIAKRFRGLASRATAVTVPTDALRSQLSAHGIDDERLYRVDDIVESPALLKEQAKLIGQAMPSRAGTWARWITAFRGRRSAPRLLWFGNRGATYASFGLSDLLLWRDVLEQAGAQLGAELWVVSNHRETFEEVSRSLRLPCVYREWSPTIVDQLLADADVCLVPNSLDAFSVTKSANRGLKALSAGVPVVATPTPAYQELGEAIWLGDPFEGITRYLGDRTLRTAHMRAAANLMERRFSMRSLEQQMTAVLDGLTMGKGA